MRRIFIFALAVALAVPSAWAAEVAVLRNGFTIRHQHHEQAGDITRLYLANNSTGYMEVPSAEIAGFDEEPDPPARPAANSSPNLDQVVQSASDRYRLDPDLVSSVIRAESGFNPHAVSRKGATGLMQLMPKTASQLGVANAFDPESNVDGGSRYLRSLLEQYNFDLIKALAAYNAGPERVQHYGGVPPYYETRAYVARIVRDFNRKKTAEESQTRLAAVNKTTKGGQLKPAVGLSREAPRRANPAVEGTE
jgi:soluble lytic murein transglycosylase-like protein